MAKKEKEDRGKKKGDRTTTVLTINKEDLAPFNELRARETGRRGTNVTQNEFIRFMLSLYRHVEKKDSTIFEEVRKKAKAKKVRQEGRIR